MKKMRRSWLLGRQRIVFRQLFGKIPSVQLIPLQIGSRRYYGSDGGGISPLDTLLRVKPAFTEKNDEEEAELEKDHLFYDNDDADFDDDDDDDDGKTIRILYLKVFHNFTMHFCSI